jgi:predicted enzyme related to lactoylglutathione lyase
MVKVLGIGGLFFRSKDPSGLAEWYQTHLGIDPAPTSPSMMPWTTEAGVTIFSPFDESTDYFPADRTFMLNFRIEDLDAALAELNAAGIKISEELTMEGIGRFARIHDPEGNPIELWEPAKP